MCCNGRECIWKRPDGVAWNLLRSAVGVILRLTASVWRNQLPGGPDRRTAYDCGSGVCGRIAKTSTRPSSAAARRALSAQTLLHGRLAPAVWARRPHRRERAGKTTPLAAPVSERACKAHHIFSFTSHLSYPPFSGSDGVGGGSDNICAGNFLTIADVTSLSGAIVRAARPGQASTASGLCYGHSSGYTETWNTRTWCQGDLCRRACCPTSIRPEPRCRADTWTPFFTIGPNLERYLADMACYRHHCRDAVGPLSVTPPAVGPIPDRPLSLSGRYTRSCRADTSYHLSLSTRYRIESDRPRSLSGRYCGFYQLNWSAIGPTWLSTDTTVGTLSARYRLPPSLSGRYRIDLSRCRPDTADFISSSGALSGRHGFLLTPLSGRYLLPLLTVDPIPDRPRSLSGRYCGFYQLNWSAIGPTWLSTDTTVGTLSARYRLPPSLSGRYQIDLSRCRPDSYPIWSLSSTRYRSNYRVDNGLSWLLSDRQRGG